MPTVEIVVPREIVKANNELFRSRCKIRDVVAGRIFMAFASLVDEKDVAQSGNFLEYKIQASSVMNNIDAGGDYYKQVKDAAYTLIDQKIERTTGRNSFQLYTLFSTIEYKDGIIRGEFHKDLKPFFISARGKFTILSLHQYMMLPSIYSQKIFGFLKSWDDKPEIIINVPELHLMLDTPESVRKDFRQFRTRVLEKAHKDITGKTTLAYEWEPVKQGRAVVAVRFIFAKKRALPVVAKKADDSRDKQNAKTNTAFIAALACLKEHGTACQGGHQKQGICDVCRTIR